MNEPVLPSASLPPPADAEQAVQRILAWREALQQVSNAASVQLMCACWVIRRDYPDEAAFAAFVGERLDGVVDPGRAWALAETWEAARGNRRLRELAMGAPDDAVRLARELAEAAEPAGQGTLALDETDRRVAEVLAAPAKRRRALMRGLVSGQEQADGAGAARIEALERERIEALERERDEALEREREGWRRRSASALLDELAAAERDVAALSEQPWQSLPPGQRDRALRIVDFCIGGFERIASGLAEDGDA